MGPLYVTITICFVHVIYVEKKMKQERENTAGGGTGEVSWAELKNFFYN